MVLISFMGFANIMFSVAEDVGGSGKALHSTDWDCLFSWEIIDEARMADVINVPVGSVLFGHW